MQNTLTHTRIHPLTPTYPLTLTHQVVLLSCPHCRLCTTDGTDNHTITGEAKFSIGKEIELTEFYIAFFFALFLRRVSMNKIPPFHSVPGHFLNIHLSLITLTHWLFTLSIHLILHLHLHFSLDPFHCTPPPFNVHLSPYSSTFHCILPPSTVALHLSPYSSIFTVPLSLSLYPFHLHYTPPPFIAPLHLSLYLFHCTPPPFTAPLHLHLHPFHWTPFTISLLYKRDKNI